MAQILLPQMIERLAASSAVDPVLVSFPTDTVPALASRPADAEIIYAAKGRSAQKPLILMGASWADLQPYITGDEAVLSIWQAVARRHWPGQLTLVLPASDCTPPALNPAGTGTLGIRVPNHPVALALLSRTGPLATTSANRSGQAPRINAADIDKTFPGVLTLPAQSFETSQPPSGTPSTVVQWSDQGWQVLRQGKIRL